jgi:hypothetical protein
MFQSTEQLQTLKLTIAQSGESNQGKIAGSILV